MDNKLSPYIFLIGSAVGFVVLLHSEPVTPTGIVAATVKIIFFMIVWAATGILLSHVERRLVFHE